MAGKRGAAVPRPPKASEYEIVFGSSEAERGRRDLKAIAKNALADAWDYLTAHPARYDAARCYRLRGDASAIDLDGRRLPQWQYKITSGARLWYAIDEPAPQSKKNGRVIITRASPGHPNETDSAKNFR